MQGSCLISANYRTYHTGRRPGQKVQRECTTGAARVRRQGSWEAAEAGQQDGRMAGREQAPESRQGPARHAARGEPGSLTPATVSEEFRRFWAERHVCILVTLRRDGTPHVVPVGAVLDLETGTVRVLCSRGSQKARNVAAAGPGEARAVVSQVDGRRWSSLEGSARIRSDPASVRDGEARYARRYRVPRVNPERVVLEISVDRVLGLH